MVCSILMSLKGWASRELQDTPAYLIMQLFISTNLHGPTTTRCWVNGAVLVKPPLVRMHVNKEYSGRLLLCCILLLSHFIVLPLSCSWDDSSSVSSGLSDTLDNISTDDLNTPAYSSGSSSHKNKSSQVRTQRGPWSPDSLLGFQGCQVHHFKKQLLLVKRSLA